MAATCPRHPDAATTDLCVGCGEFVCAECAFVASDRRVFCPGCKQRLSAEELAPPPDPAAAAAAPVTAAPARRPPVPLVPLQILPPSEPLSPLGYALKHSPLSIVSLATGLVAFAWYPIAFLGFALGLQEMRRHIAGTSQGSLALTSAGIVLNAAALLVHMAMWKGK